MEVMPGLFLGNEADSRNADRFDMVVNCTADLPFHGDSSRQSQVRVPVKDNGDPRQQELFVEHASNAVTHDAVSDTIVGGGRVLVHCRAGQQRSAAFVAVVLCRSGMFATPDDAVEFIRHKKRDAFLGSVNFSKALHRMFPKEYIDPLSIRDAVPIEDANR
jgi:protein-tyrosine phosphatase